MGFRLAHELYPLGRHYTESVIPRYHTQTHTHTHRHTHTHTHTHIKLSIPTDWTRASQNVGKMSSYQVKLSRKRTFHYFDIGDTWWSIECWKHATVCAVPIKPNYMYIPVLPQIKPTWSVYAATGVTSHKNGDGLHTFGWCMCSYSIRKSIKMFLHYSDLPDNEETVICEGLIAYQLEWQWVT